MKKKGALNLEYIITIVILLFLAGMILYMGYNWIQKKGDAGLSDLWNTKTDDTNKEVLTTKPAQETETDRNKEKVIRTKAAQQILLAAIKTCFGQPRRGSCEILKYLRTLEKEITCTDFKKWAGHNTEKKEVNIIDCAKWDPKVISQNTEKICMGKATGVLNTAVRVCPGCKSEICLIT